MPDQLLGASSEQGLGRLVLEGGALAAAGKIRSAVECARHRPVRRQARERAVREAHCLRGLFLEVPLDVGAHGDRGLQPGEVRRRALVAVRGAQVPVGVAVLRACLARVPVQVERREAVDGIFRWDHQVDNLLGKDVMVRSVHLPREVGHGRGGGHDVAGRPAAEDATHLPVVVAVQHARRHVVGGVVVPMNRRVVPRRTHRGEHQLLLEVRRQRGGLVQRLPRRVLFSGGQDHAQQHEVRAAVAERPHHRHQTLAPTLPVLGHPRHAHQPGRRPIVRRVTVKGLPQGVRGHAASPAWRHARRRRVEIRNA
mmetsp:Transcript_50443/g.153406  ORF Transcript_50443/g.153406 Transcript_50443/m.153406 type:complete len:311 (+) Transcript_50443:63-995(+)